MPTYKIAIVGAGPAGYFTAQALQNSATEDLAFEIDMIERLPTPWGLVRSGVAPDHPKIKTVAKVFEKVATEPGFRLFGNVELGAHIQLEDLTSRYDAVVMCTGSSIGKKLGIPGEDLPNSLSAADFVPWYNGHPDFASLKVDLSGSTAVVIGAGNVAMDCARMLALEAHELDTTDTADYSLAALHNSNVHKVFIAGRRGPEFAAFTAPELRDLPKLEHTNVYINAAEVEAAHARAEAAGEIEKHLASNLEAMRLIAESEKSENRKSLEFLFSHKPKQILGTEKVEGIVFETSEGDKTILCDLVISAIGYYCLMINGITFENGRIANIDGRVPGTNMYTVGWAKRGPSGVIGTNKSDASDVVKILIEELGSPKNAGDIKDVLHPEHAVIDQTAWTRINGAEIAAGEPLGKPRKKVTSIEELVRLGR
jgi:ferredoxin--NADP+ reductase